MFVLSWRNVLNRVEKYKYLGIILNEYFVYDTTAIILSEAAGSALCVYSKNLDTFQIWDLKRL